MIVSTILRRKGGSVITMKPEQTIAEAVDLLAAKRIGAVVVADGKRGVAGILSERDIVRGIADRGGDILSARVDELMTREVETCEPRDNIDRLMRQMTEGRFRHLPVLDEGRLVGVISIGDVVKSRISELEHETEAMRDYIAGHG